MDQHSQPVLVKSYQHSLCINLLHNELGLNETCHKNIIWKWHWVPRLICRGHSGVWGRPKRAKFTLIFKSSNLILSLIQLECGTWYHHPRRLQCVKFSKSQRDIIDAVTISKITVFEIICNVAYYSAAKITFPIAQPSNKATKCGIRGFWKLKVKPNLGCCSNIAITISYISAFVSSW